MKKLGYADEQIEFWIDQQPTTLKQELQDIAKELPNARIPNIYEVIKHFPPGYDKDILEINEKLKLFPYPLMKRD